MPEATKAAKAKDLAKLGCSGVLIVFGFIFVTGYCSHRSERAAKAEKERAEAAAQPTAAVSVRAEQPAPKIVGQELRIKQAPNDRLICFPTEEGLDEFGKAAATGDERAQQLALTSNGGYWVDAGTDVTLLDLGIAQSKTRVLEGPHAGKVCWVVSEWVANRTAEPAPTASTARNAPAVCTISPPKKATSIPVFPTIIGLAEWRLAISNKDTKAAQVAFEANGGFRVEAGATCLRLTAGEQASEIRITSGKHRGKAGWAPTNYTLGN
jgi:hypothetical protein